MVNAVNGASLPPTINLSAMPALNHATPFKRAWREVEQVMEWEISGPFDFRSCATQDDILPKVVVGEDKVDDLFLSRNS